MSDNPTQAAHGRCKRLFAYFVLLGRHCWRRTQSHNASATSASLAYSTIFAFIPTIVLAFLVLKAAGVIENSKQTLHELLETTGMTQIRVRVGDDNTLTATQTSEPAVENVAEQIETLVTNVEQKMTFARLGPIGLILLAWSAITLLTTAERSLNRAFDAPRSRPLMIRAMLYWSAITFVPVILVALSYLNALALQTARQTAMIHAVYVVVDLVSSLLIGILLLALVYKYLPNTHVPFRAALLGAAVIVPVLILARWGFGLYVSKVVAKGSVYGALGLLPLFLIWINFWWYAFLFGGELAYTVINLRRLVAAETADRILLGPMDMLAAAMAVSGSYLRNEGPMAFDEIARQLDLPDESVHRLIDRLTTGNILCTVDSDTIHAFVPAKPPDAILVGDILALGTRDVGGEIPMGLNPQLAAALAQVRDRSRQTMGTTTLAQLLAKEA